LRPGTGAPSRYDPVGGSRMVWFWTRDQEELQFETMYDNDTGEFLVRLTFSNGEQRTERFAKIDKFKQRLLQLEGDLQVQRWRNSGPPLFVPEGFPNRRLK
jgi:hypothetical protein